MCVFSLSSISSALTNERDARALRETSVKATAGSSGVKLCAISSVLTNEREASVWQLDAVCGQGSYQGSVGGGNREQTCRE